MSKPLRCKLGLHKWGREHYAWDRASNVRDYKKRCKLCGKTKHWIKEAPKWE